MNGPIWKIFAMQMGTDNNNKISFEFLKNTPKCGRYE